MGQNSKNIFRIFLIGVLMMLATSVILSCLTGDCFHWVATFAAILVLHRVVRGGDR